jgi:hypothetical protein
MSTGARTGVAQLPLKIRATPPAIASTAQGQSSGEMVEPPPVGGGTIGVRGNVVGLGVGGAAG